MCRADKKAKLTAAGYSAVFIPSRFVCFCKSQLLCRPFCVFVEKPPPCHLPAAATPHARRAHPTAKNFVFASGPPSYRPGEVRGAASLELRPFISFPSLAQTHMFLVSEQFSVYGFFTMAQHQLAIRRVPAGTLGFCQVHAAS